MPQVLERETGIDLKETLFGSGSGVVPPARQKAPGTRRWIWIVSALGLLMVAGVAWRWTAKPAAPKFGTARVERGTIAKTISATGRLQALTTVQVGTQASGTISEIYVDFNSTVKKDQIIARLDPSQLQAQLTQAMANLTATQAGVQSAQSAVINADASVEAATANVDRLQSVVDDAQRNLDRTKELVEAQVSARRDLETAQATLNQALAQKQQGVAQVTQARAQAQSARAQANQARAQATQASAAVDVARVNLDHTVIKAPIDGVVVARSVDVGQTVASSLQAPTLFQIANDLTRMQVLADIDEADVGQLQPQSKVNFSVDAYPTETFSGTISQIRLAPQTVQNVVTYTAVIDVANPDLKLKPGMTANVNAIVSEQKDVVKVPAAALRFRPDNATAAPARRGTGTIYRINGENLEPVNVRTGLTDGVAVQIVSGDLKPGDTVAVPNAGTASRGAGAPRTSNPLGGMGGGRGAGRIR